MWEPPADLDSIVQLHAVRTFSRAWERARLRTGQMRAQAAAKGVLLTSGLTASVQDMVVQEFKDAGATFVSGMLGFASDLGNQSEAIDWLERASHSALEEALPPFLLAFGVERQGQLGSTERAHDVAKRGIAQVQQDSKLAFGRLRLRANRQLDAVSEPLELRDFFVSHAGEDRAEIVAPLVAELESRGKAVWYSEFQISVGDSLRRRIDEGLRVSRYGIVVLSLDFFRKPWPQAELDGLVARSTAEGRKVILPVWHKLDQAGIASRSPMLAGLVGIDTTVGIKAVADALIAATR